MKVSGTALKATRGRKTDIIFIIMKIRGYIGRKYPIKGTYVWKIELIGYWEKRRVTKKAARKVFKKSRFGEMLKQQMKTHGYF